MTNQEIVQRVMAAKKGTYIKLTKVKDLGQGVVKESDMVIRLGVDYSHLAINEGKETGSLKWGHWVEGLEGLVLEHKGNYYLRVTSTDPAHPESGADVIATRYIQNNKQISKDEVLNLIGEKPMCGSASAVYNIKFENIVSIGS